MEYPTVPPRYLALLALLLVLNVVDVGTTVYALENGCIEANPIMRDVAHDPVIVMGAKMLMIGAVAFLAMGCDRLIEGSGVWCLGAATAFYVLPVVNNVCQIMFFS